jgi:hypothetical protein
MKLCTGIHAEEPVQNPDCFFEDTAEICENKLCITFSDILGNAIRKGDLQLDKQRDSPRLQTIKMDS